MKVKVVKEFHDKDNFAKVYEVDNLLDLPAGRVQELKALGVVVEIRDKNTKASKK
jgi:hypothetical protein